MINKNINVSAIIKARMCSTRLLGKVLKNIENKTCLEYLILRLQKVEELNNIIVATSTNKKDNSIERLCKKNKLSY